MNHTSRTVTVSDPLWKALETMSREMGVDRDVLLNQAIFSLARQFGFITPTQVSLLDGAASAPRAPEPVPARAVAPQPVEVVALSGDGARGAASKAPPPVEAEAPSEKAAEPEPEAAEAKVDVEALRQGVVARMRDVIADVDRLVEPVDERLRDEAEEDADDEDTSEDDDASDDEDESDEDASDIPTESYKAQDASDDDEDASDDDEDASDDEDLDAAAALNGLLGDDDDEDSPSETGRAVAPTPKPPAPVETTIVVKTTSGVPLHIKLDDGEPVRVARERFVIGRGAHCDLVVKSARVSREHAVVIREGAEFFIEDLTSSNGTWFDNTRITRRLVSDGEEYLLGGIRVTFSLG